MIFKFSVILACLPYLSALPENTTVTPSAKPKRNLVEGNHGAASPNPVFFYLETPQNAASSELQAAATSVGPTNLYPNPQKPLALVRLQQPLQIYGQPGANNQVAQPPLLYDFKQSPTNVHLKNRFRPSVEVTTPRSYYLNNAASGSIQPLASIRPAAPILQAPRLPQNQFTFRPKPHAIGLIPGAPPSRPATSATIVNPVQHFFYTNHNPQNAQFTPLLQVQNTEASRAPAATYFTAFNQAPNPVIPETKLTPHSIYYMRKYHNQQKLPLINFAQQQNAPPGNGGISTQAQLPNDGANLPPITKHAGSPEEMQQIEQPQGEEEEEEDDGEEEKSEEEDKEAEGEQEEDEEEEESDKENQSEEAGDDAEEETDEETEEKENQEEEENKMEEKFLYGTFPFEAGVMVNEYEKDFFKPLPYVKTEGQKPDCDKVEDEDGSPDASRQKTVTFYQYPSLTTEFTNPHNYNDFYEGFSTNSKYNVVKPGVKKFVKKSKPFAKFKKVKYSKTKKFKPKTGRILGSYSEESPVTHNQKVFAQTWLMTKNIGG